MADAQLSVTLSADITNFRANLTAAAAEVSRTGAAAQVASNNITAAIGRINSINTAGLSSGLNTGVAAARVLGSEISRLSTNISRNIAAFNKGAVDRYIASLNTATSSVTSLSSSSAVLSTNISRNVAAFNGVNISRFVGQLNQTNSALTLTASVSTSASRGLAQIAAASASTGRAVATGSNQASFALTNLGRVAQDAPFGFIGIQNNLNPLLESFQRLRAETGSNSAALRALGQSFLGPAGIGVALSLITSAITFYTMWQQKSNKATKEAKTDTDAYINSLDQLTKSKLKGNQNAQKEITDLTTMYAISQNTTLAYKTRKEAVDQLQKQYPDYFKNIKDETILNGGAKTAYDNLTTSILATARARAAQDQITKNASKILENEQKLLDNEAKIKNNAIAKEKELTALKERTKNLPGSEAVVSQKQELENRALKANITLTEYQRKRQEEIAILTARNKNLAKSVMDEVKGGADVIGDFGSKVDKTGKKLKTLPQIMKELSTSLMINENQFKQTFEEKNEGKISAYQSAIESLIANGFNPASDAMINLKKQQKDLFQLAELNKFVSANTGLNSLGVTNAPRTAKGKTAITEIDQSKRKGSRLANITKEQDKILKAQIKFNDDFNKLVGEGLSGGIASLAESFGKVLSNGGNIFEALGASLLGSLGGVLTQLGEMAIGVGVGLVAIKKALQSLNPAVAIAGGVALVALGAFVSSKSKSIGGSIQGGNATKPTAFANGGIVYGPTLGLMGEYSGAANNPEVIAPLNKLKGLIGDNTPNFEVVQYIQGDKLAVLVRNANEKKSRTS